MRKRNNPAALDQLSISFKVGGTMTEVMVMGYRATQGHRHGTTSSPGPGLSSGGTTSSTSPWTPSQPAPSTTPLSLRSQPRCATCPPGHCLLESKQSATANMTVCYRQFLFRPLPLADLRHLNSASLRCFLCQRRPFSGDFLVCYEAVMCLPWSGRLFAHNDSCLPWMRQNTA